MEKVELTPFKRRLGSVCCIGHSGLDALDMANMLDRVSRAVARRVAPTGQRRGKQSGEPAGNDESLHLFERWAN